MLSISSIIDSPSVSWQAKVLYIHLAKLEKEQPDPWPSSDNIMNHCFPSFSHGEQIIFFTNVVTELNELGLVDFQIRLAAPKQITKTMAETKSLFGSRK
jgi:hypothetical protein